jgi:hypothetical protein
MTPTSPPAPTALRTSADLAPTGERSWRATAAEGGGIRLELDGALGIALDDGGRAVLPSDAAHRALRGTGIAWVLPAEHDGGQPAWLVRAAPDAAIEVEARDADVVVTVHAESADIERHRARPHADALGDAFELDLPDGAELADALATAYWGTMLPSVVERTRAAGYPDAEGFVLSTLASKYGGTYPDVDHEFQIKGRLAWGGDLDVAVVRRMLDLQLRMMREDPQQLWRDPCAVQPDGDREYHVRRGSLDARENAVMFLVTGNIEVVESAWLYVARTKDLDWLRGAIGDLEGAWSLVEGLVDPLGRLWSDVYYEDQVIKDGRETMAQALAVRSAELLAELQRLVGRDDAADRSIALRDRLAAALARPLPEGFWDPEARRFVDWVDRAGRVHDHIHLLANILPPLVGAADGPQTADVLELVRRELDEFQRFPTFLSARIADYTASEIGDGGPYDLCAAGRYWCWDAAFWRARGDGRMLHDQLVRVARQLAIDGTMGERYDMGHVYYVDGTDWHGAAHYYEYPCVFSWVLLHEHLGVRAALDADLLIAPVLDGPGGATLRQSSLRVRYRLDDGRFELENLADAARTFRVELGDALAGPLVLRRGDADAGPLPAGPIELAAGETVAIEPAAAA